MCNSVNTVIPCDLYLLPYTYSILFCIIYAVFEVGDLHSIKSVVYHLTFSNKVIVAICCIHNKNKKCTFPFR